MRLSPTLRNGGEGWGTPRLVDRMRSIATPAGRKVGPPADILFVLEHLKPEVPYLREKLIAGEIDGSQYEGECACLIGSLGKADGGTDEVCKRIPFYKKGLHNPGEQWFWQIRKGDTPKNSFFAEHALKLIEMVLGESKPAKKKAAKKAA